MRKKTAKKLLMSRYIKVLTTKISEFKNAVVLLYAYDNNNSNDFDVDDLRELAKRFDGLESSGSYFIIGQDVGVDIYDRNEVKDKDIIITVSHNGNIDTDDVEQDFKKAFKEAKSVTVVCTEAKNIAMHIK